MNEGHTYRAHPLVRLHPCIASLVGSTRDHSALIRSGRRKREGDGLWHPRQCDGVCAVAHWPVIHAEEIEMGLGNGEGVCGRGVPPQPAGSQPRMAAGESSAARILEAA